MTADLALPVDPIAPPFAAPAPTAATTPRRSRKRAATLVPGDRVSAWRVERELGRGGMGSVYAVVHNGFGKRAALKICHSSVLGPTFTMETFLREARIVHLVDHPGVVDVFATGTFDKRPYLAMERLVGQTLGERIDARSAALGNQIDARSAALGNQIDARSAALGNQIDAGPLPRHEAIDILLELCDVLAAAHAHGIVHRDLKLDNIFLLDAPAAGGRRVKLLDWGVAKIAGEADPMQGMVAGTLTYVAPEQIRGDDITPAADLYSLGVVAYKLLLGAAPFAAEADLDLLRMHLRASPPPPEARWLDIPAPLARLLLKLLAKQPGERPSLDEVVAVLTATRRILVPRRSLFSRLHTIPPVPPVDVLGRPAPVFALQHRAVGALFGVAALAASAVTWLFM